MNGFFVTGTDTDVGKTLVSAWLLTHLDAMLLEAGPGGSQPETDSAIVRRLAEVAARPHPARGLCAARGDRAA